MSLVAIEYVPFYREVAHASTDAVGRFRIASTRQHLDTLHVLAEKAGYLYQDTTVVCGPSCATISLIEEYDDGSRKVYLTRVKSFGVPEGGATALISRKCSMRESSNRYGDNFTGDDPGIVVR